MGELVDRLGNKSAGQLIKSEHWNELVAAIENLSTTVDERFAEVDARFQEFSATVDERFQELGARVEALAEDFGDFRGAVEPLLGEYYRLTMETTRTRYAIGELAEITARVTDLRGNPLDLSDEADRPWIDFVVASWGQLKPVAGFESLGGAGDRTISVRTDAQGVARVHLRSDHAEGFTDEDEAEVAVSLQTRLPATDRSIVETILSAATPIEAKERGAFRVLTAEYDRTDAPRVSKYADAYFSKNVPLIVGRTPPIFTHRWRDYRSTVMAFARRDSDPVTPDQSRGVSSIQVTFRDWIAPWIITDYFVETDTLVESFRDRLIPKIVDDLDQSVRDVKVEVNDFIFDKGLIGRQRNYQVMREAFDTATPPQRPAYGLKKLTEPMQDALGVQQTLESAQGIGPTGQEVAFRAFTGAAVRAEDAVVRVDAQIGQVQEQLTGYVDEQLGGARDQLLFQVQQEQASLKDELLAENGPIQTVHKSLQTVTGQVQGFQTALNAKADVQTLARFLPR
jgi:hypothetical protein